MCTQPGTLPARFGGFISATDLFDVALFGLSGSEAELMDAQQRLLLETTLEVWPPLHCNMIQCYAPSDLLPSAAMPACWQQAHSPFVS